MVNIDSVYISILLFLIGTQVMNGTSILQWILAQEQVHHYFVMFSVWGVNLPWTNAHISQLKTRPAMQLELCVLVCHILLCMHSLYEQIYIYFTVPCSSM